MPPLYKAERRFEGEYMRRKMKNERLKT